MSCSNKTQLVFHHLFKNGVLKKVSSKVNKIRCKTQVAKLWQTLSSDIRTLCFYASSFKLYVQNGTLENLKKPSVQVFSENQTNYVKTRFESNKKISLFRNRNEGQTNITNITPTPLQVKIFNKLFTDDER